METSMRVFVTGVACVGKTTIGRKLAELLGLAFFDLDHEIEAFFGTSIERLQNKHLTTHSYREAAAKALVDVLRRPESENSVIALPPSGLMGGYWRAVKKSTGIIIVLTDKPQNILERITIYDEDSKLIEKKVTPREKPLYLAEIREDIAYYGRTYKRAHSRVDIAGLSPDDAAERVREAVLAVSRPAE